MIEYVPMDEILGTYRLQDDKIYINTNLKNYKLLHDYVINHERKHQLNYLSNKSFLSKILYDVKLDFDDTFYISKELKIERQTFSKNCPKMNMYQIFYNILYYFFRIIIVDTPYSFIYLFKEIQSFLRRGEKE